MATNNQVFHIEKRVSIAAGLNRHVTRRQFVVEGEHCHVDVWVPDNADPGRTAGNVELVPRTVTLDNGKTSELTLQQAVDKRIQEAGIRPRKGQTTCMEMIFSGSHDRMMAMSREELLQWADDTVKWAQKTWGKENVVSASLHVDEETPHIHMIVVPIVTGQSRRTKSLQRSAKSTRKYNIDPQKLRLCVDEVHAPNMLYAYHDSYAKEVSSKYGMERGVRAEPGSKKKHTDSIDYNRKLAVQAAEQRSLIEELTSDYDKKQEDIQLLQGQVDTLSSAVKKEEEKLAKAKNKARKAEEDSMKAEEKLSNLESKIQHNEGVIKQRRKIYDEIQDKIENNKGIIDKQVADFKARKEELSQTKTDISANKETIAQQEKTIAANDATIQNQEKLKASTIISDEAVDNQIIEKLQTLKALEEEESRLNRSIITKKTELSTVDANVRNRRMQLIARVNLDDVPHKGAFGYNSDKVTAFIESVNNARLLGAMNQAPQDIKVDTAVQEENTRLRKVEDDYKDFKNSPERMRQRIEHLENEALRYRIAETLKYAFLKDVEVIRFTADKTPKGDDIFIKFTIKGDSTKYAGRITPEERIIYTEKDLNTLQECKDNSHEKIWRILSLSSIRQKREKEDNLSRFSTKLSMLTEENIKVTDYEAEGKHILLFATNGRVYEVEPDGRTWSTADKRVKTLADCSMFSEERIWLEHGNINNLKIDQASNMRPIRLQRL